MPTFFDLWEVLEGPSAKSQDFGFKSFFEKSGKIPFLGNFLVSSVDLTKPTLKIRFRASNRGSEHGKVDVLAVFVQIA